MLADIHPTTDEKLMMDLLNHPSNVTRPFLHVNIRFLAYTTNILHKRYLCCCSFIANQEIPLICDHIQLKYMNKIVLSQESIHI